MLARYTYASVIMPPLEFTFLHIILLDASLLTCCPPFAPGGPIYNPGNLPPFTGLKLGAKNTSYENLTLLAGNMEGGEAYTPIPPVGRADGL